MIDKQLQEDTHPTTQTPSQNKRRSGLAKFFMAIGLLGVAQRFGQTVPTMAQGDTEDANSHRFLLQVVQPGLAGLMDGSVSTLAPIFATAFATHRPGPRWALTMGKVCSNGTEVSRPGSILGVYQSIGGEEGA